MDWKAKIRTRRAPAVEPPPAISHSLFNGLGQDIRYAARVLRRQPRYACLATLTMALGIGATALLFSVTYGVLMQPLPWPNGDRLVLLKETRGGNPPRFNAFSNTAYLAWADHASTVEHIAAWTQRTMTLTGGGDPERIRITSASASLFPVLGIRPLIGSVFDRRDETSPVVVLSEGMWRQRFAADPGILGRPLTLDGEPYTVIGVLPDAAAYPDGQARAWIPFPVPLPTGNLLSMFSAVALLRPGATAAQAAAEGTARGRFAADTGMTTTAIFGSNGPVEITAQPLREAVTADVRQPLVIMLAAGILLLLTATANVASLQLARATTRRREMGIRAALGAGAGRATRQLLAESLMVSLAGGGAGLAVAWLLQGSLPTLLPADFPRVTDIRINATVIGVTFALSVLTGLVFGLLPALRVRRLDLISSLTEDGNAPVGAGSRSATARARMLIIAGQVAIACVLLVGASLLGRSFGALIGVDRGYDPQGLITARVSLPPSTHTPARRYTVVSDILARLARTPGVTDAAFTSELPLTPGGSTAGFNARSRVDGTTVAIQASPRIVSSRYFTTMGMRVIAGRGFSETDTESAPAVAVVNRAFARRYLGDSALGVTVPMGVGYRNAEVEATIVGVIEDVRYLAAKDSAVPELYYTFRQFGATVPVSTITLLARTPGDPAALLSAMRTGVREADGTLALESVMTMEDRMLRGLARPRLYAILLGGFALTALLVAAVGLFGVLSYSVALRSRELAVRTALGARRIDIIRLVVGQSLSVTLAGIAAGLVAALALTRSVATLLYGITAHDTVTYIAVPAILLAVSLVACIPPARRAASADPVTVLRSQ